MNSDLVKIIYLEEQIKLIHLKDLIQIVLDIILMKIQIIFLNNNNNHILIITSRIIDKLIKLFLKIDI